MARKKTKQKKQLVNNHKFIAQGLCCTYIFPTGMLKLCLLVLIAVMQEFQCELYYALCKSVSVQISFVFRLFCVCAWKEKLAWFMHLLHNDIVNVHDK